MLAASEVVDRNPVTAPGVPVALAMPPQEAQKSPDTLSEVEIAVVTVHSATPKASDLMLPIVGTRTFTQVVFLPDRIAQSLVGRVVLGHATSVVFI